MPPAMVCAKLCQIAALRSVLLNFFEDYHLKPRRLLIFCMLPVVVNITRVSGQRRSAMPCEDVFTVKHTYNIMRKR